MRKVLVVNGINIPVTLKLALLALEARSEQYLLIAEITGGYHIKGLGESVRYIVGHTTAHVH